MADKDYEGLLAEFEPVLAHVVCTQNSTDAVDARRRAGRGRAAGSSARTGSARRPRWPTRSTRPRPWPRPAGSFGEAIGSGGVLVTGSVVTVGEARAMLALARREQRLMQRRLCAAILLLEAIVFGLSTPVLISVADVGTATGAVDRARPRPSRCLLVAGLLRLRLGLLAGLGGPGGGDRGRVRGHRRCSSSARSSSRCGPRRTSWAARSRSSAPSGRPGRVPGQGLSRASLGCAPCPEPPQRTLVLLKPDAVRRGLVGQHPVPVRGQGAGHRGARAAAHRRARRPTRTTPSTSSATSTRRCATSSPAGRSSPPCSRATRRSRWSARINGATDGRKAAPGTIRGDLSLSNRENLVHGSDARSRPSARSRSGSPTST